MKKTLRGFTLVELLVVIAIIGLLSTVAVVALNSARTKSRDAKRVADIKQIQTAFELYFNDNNKYPVEGTRVALGTGTRTMLVGTGFASAPSGTTYMGLIPLDPNGSTTACDDASVATTSCTYSYMTPTVGGVVDAAPTTYKMWFHLEEKTAGLAAGLKCATEAGISEPKAGPAC